MNSKPREKEEVHFDKPIHSLKSNVFNPTITEGNEDEEDEKESQEINDEDGESDEIVDYESFDLDVNSIEKKENQKPDLNLSNSKLSPKNHQFHGMNLSQGSVNKQSNKSGIQKQNSLANNSPFKHKLENLNFNSLSESPIRKLSYCNTHKNPPVDHQFQVSDKGIKRSNSMFKSDVLENSLGLKKDFNNRYNTNNMNSPNKKVGSADIHISKLTETIQEDRNDMENEYNEGGEGKSGVFNTNSALNSDLPGIRSVDKDRKDTIESSDYILEANVIEDLKGDKVKHFRKEDIVHILMNTEIMHKKEEKKDDRPLSGTKNRYSNSKSKVKEFINTEYKPYIERLKKKELILEENDPNSEVLKHLMKNKTLTSKSKRNLLSPGSSSKTSSNNLNLLEKQTHHLAGKNTQRFDKILNELNDDFKKIHTFSPRTKANFQKNNSKPNLNQFLNSQSNHLRKIEEKINTIKEQNKQKEDDYEKENKFITSEKSRQMNEKNQYDEEPFFERLSKKKISTVNILENHNANKNNIKAYDRSPSLGLLDNRYDQLYKDSFKRKEKFDKLKEKVLKEEIENDYVVNKESNKYCFGKFRSHFNEVISTFTQEGKIDLQSLNVVLLALKFVQNEKQDTEENKKEAKLKNEIWNLLKRSENNEEFISPEDLFLFLLCVMNLYEFFIISKSHQKTTMHDDHGTKETFMNIDRVVSLEKLNSQINGRICNTKKYGGSDSEGNFILTSIHAKAISRDFNIYYVNRSNQLTNENKKKKKLSLQINNDPFKPQIDPISEKLSSEYKKKVANDLPENMGGDKLSYVDILMFKRQQRLNKNIKLQEEYKQKELDMCTFSPKINKHVEIKDYEAGTRIQFLYNKGTEKNKNTKTTFRPKDEIEINRDAEEYTFKPNIPDKYNVTGTESNISNTKDIVKMKERLKKCREEKTAKEKILSRGEIFNEKKSKSTSRLPTQQTISSTSRKKIEAKIPLIEKINLMFIHDELRDSNLIKKYSPTKKKQSPKAKKQSIFSLKSESERKSAIPVLIIDINLQNGLKENIYVYDGDTAEDLAAGFAKEHDLDKETESKLCVGIKGNMAIRMLGKINEEDGEHHTVNSTFN